MIDIRQGDCLERLREMPEGSVHCVVTSPPYWGLRDYGVEGQLGLEKTPEEYVAKMVEVFREVRRVLRDDGSCWINLGDSYAHNGPCGGSSPDGPRKPRETDAAKQRDMDYRVPVGLKPKDLIGVPWRVAFALQADGWWLRSDIVWAKPNPMPESVTDRPTKAHEYVFLLTKSARYFYDADAVREAGKDPVDDMRRINADRTKRYSQAAQEARPAGAFTGPRLLTEPAGRNLRSVWTIATAPYPEAHFATFPPKLVEPCIRAGTSEHGVCPECGGPWVRQVSEKVIPLQATNNARSCDQNNRGDMPRANVDRETTGWLPSCECWGKFIDCSDGRDHPPFGPVPATILDPFCGSGTVGQVCIAERRHFIGIELNPEYCELAERRTSGVQVRAF